MIIGIDPGATGGMAWWSVTDGAGSYAFTNQTEKDIVEQLREVIADVWPKHRSLVYLEKVSAMPGHGEKCEKCKRAPAPTTSSFNFGQSYGFLRGIVLSHGLALHDITPQKWCQHFGLKKKKGETNTQWKNRHKAKAQQLFPDQKVTHAVADALLIMNYGYAMSKETV